MVSMARSPTPDMHSVSFPKSILVHPRLRWLALLFILIDKLNLLGHAINHSTIEFGSVVPREANLFREVVWQYSNEILVPLLVKERSVLELHIVECLPEVLLFKADADS
ncbi:hypothetical protein MRB53_038790 [Persea americana]|nr:hypothetical protein MRB53_038790 [Persea americana]